MPSHAPFWARLLLVLSLVLGGLFAVSTLRGGELDWHPISGGRVARTPRSGPARDGFTRLNPLTTGILFTNSLPESTWLTNVMLLNGSGVAAGDFDGDGWCDLFFCGLAGPNALFRNLGQGRFENVGAASGLGSPGPGWCTGVAAADVDGDGDLDLIINTLGRGTSIWINDGRGRFSRSQTVNLGKGGMSIALADVDGDGDLDLYVTNYRVWTYRDRPAAAITLQDQGGVSVVTAFEGRPVSDPDLEGRFLVDPSGGVQETGDVDFFALNDGHGRFTPVSFTGGTFVDEEGRVLKEPPRDWGLSVIMRDLNGDGAPDIYICNDFASPDRLWINDGHGGFRAAPHEALRSISRFSMGVDVADVNRDGIDDLLVVDMLSPRHTRRAVQLGNIQPVQNAIGDFIARAQYSRNTLQLGRGDGTYAEVAGYAGLMASEWTWGVVFLDVDLDGYEDVLTITGNEIDSMDIDVTNEAGRRRNAAALPAMEVLRLRKLYGRLSPGKMAFRNHGGLRFTDESARWGYDSGGVATGIALADLDNDGDMDVVVSHLNGPAEVFRNDSGAPRLGVRLKGEGGNSRGIGARLRVSGGPVVQTQEIMAGGRYLSGDDPMRCFAAGPGGGGLSLEVVWRDGRRSLLTNLPPDSVCEVDQAAAPLRPEPDPAPAPAARPLFEDLSQLLHHTHTEEPFDDFERQSLLPHRLSQLGPGVCWQDVDGDGWEDLVVTSGKGGLMGLFRNQQGRDFIWDVGAPFNVRATRDQTAVLAVNKVLLVGSSHYEDGRTNGGCLRVYSTATRTAGESLLGAPLCAGPLAMADLDGDGDLDLFIGGRAVAGRYPEPPVSLLLRNDQGRFRIVGRWGDLGMVSGATFADLDGDGHPELLLACDYGPVRVIRLRGFEREDLTHSLGLESWTGRWNGIVAGDFDEDGNVDFVATNWGLNQSVSGFGRGGLHLVYGDFTGGGGVEILESYREPELGRLVPVRSYGAIATALPFIRERILDYHAFAQLEVPAILGDHGAAASFLHAAHLETTLFLNRGDRFEPHPLPPEAQFAPAFGVSVADFDGDGHEDLFLAQNFHAMNPDGWRMDAGRGLVLLGDGRGGFQPLSGQRSGVRVYGEQRACAVADYDGDGRMDLVVTQNGGQTRLLHNTGGVPGVRVRVEGSVGNPAGVGTSFRLWQGGRGGARREVRAGGGYWAQDGATLVFHPSGPGTAELEVRFPGEESRRVPIPAGARALVLPMAVGVKELR